MNHSEPLSNSTGQSSDISSAYTTITPLFGSLFVIAFGLALLYVWSFFQVCSVKNHQHPVPIMLMTWMKLHSEIPETTT